MNLFNGVWLVDHSFHRGYDLKLSVDATVLIYSNRGKLDHTEAKQMIGRGSRSMGVATGSIYIVDSDNTPLSAPIMDFLSMRDNIVMDDGANILRGVLAVIGTNPGDLAM